MKPDYWEKQEDSPLFEDILWSRPENKAQAGKLLIVGGSGNGFSSVGKAYQLANKCGIGKVYVAIPRSLKSIVGDMFDNIEYLEKTALGSISGDAANQLIGLAGSADAVIFSGDLSNNSETVNLINSVVPKITVPIILCGDAVSAVKDIADEILNAPNITLVSHFGDLQRIVSGSSRTEALNSEMGALNLIEALHNITEQNQCAIVTRLLNNILVASGGKVISNSVDQEFENWAIDAAACTSVFQAQKLGDKLQTSASAIWEIKK